MPYIQIEAVHPTPEQKARLVAKSHGAPVKFSAWTGSSFMS